MSDKLKELEARRAARRAATEEARADQYEKDLEALDALEAEHGDTVLGVLEVSGYVPDLPTLVVVKSPGGTPFYKRYTDQVRKAGKNTALIGHAQELLGESCIVYPADAETRKAMFEAFPGTAISAGIRAVKFVELEAEEEKKG